MKAKSKLVVLIETTELIGTGKQKDNDPYRELISWWTLDGELVTQKDSWKEAQEAEDDDVQPR